MWIIIRVLAGIALLAIVEIYFIKKSGKATRTLFPKLYKKEFPIASRVFLIWLNLYPVVLILLYTYAAISGDFISLPESKVLDYLLIYPFWILFVLMMQAGVLFLLIDILKLVLFPIYKKKKEKLLKPEAAIVIFIIAFFAIYVPVRIIYDYNTVSVRIVNYTKKSLPQDFNNFKIVLIADLQADEFTDDARLDNYLNKVNNLNPDLILIAGDFITSSPKYINVSAKHVGKLKAKYGVYACIGDHDNWAYRSNYKRSVTEIENALMKNNVPMLDNTRKTITVDSSKINITFVTNTYVETIKQSVLDTLTSNSSGDLKIFLAHQPRQTLINSAVKNNYDLYLCGHTHGGQVSLVFPFRYLTPTMFETKYIRGNFNFGNMLMIVTRGLGMSIAPIRYNSTPEITLIVLNKK